MAPLEGVYQRRESSLPPSTNALIVSFNDYKFELKDHEGKGMTNMGPKSLSQSSLFERAHNKHYSNQNQSNVLVSGSRRLRRLSTISSDQNKRDCGLINIESNSKKELN